MKLLICTQVVDRNHPILGFFHSWIFEFSKYFSEVHVICLEKGEYELPDHVRIYSLGKERGASKLSQLGTFYRVFAQVFFRVRVDYVFFHMGAIYNLLAAPFFVVRKLYTTKFYWWKTHGQINTMGRLALIFTDRVYTAAAASFPIRSQKRLVIGHAIDLDLFSLPVSEERNVDILFAGRFSRTKKIEQVIKTIALLQQREQSLRVVLVGEATDKIYHQEIIDLINANDLSDTIEIRPPVNQSELLKLYQSAVIFMNPSEHDGLDKVILEAMACGCIPITGNKAFEAMLLPHRLFEDKGDIRGFAAQAQKILSWSEAEKYAMINALRASVEQNHSLATLYGRIFTHD